MNHAMLVLAAAVLGGHPALAAERLPASEVQRRSQVLISQLGLLPVMGDDLALDRWSDALELALDSAPTVRWDDAAVLGRRALLTLDSEVEASLQAAAAPATSAAQGQDPSSPSPHPPPPAMVAYDQIMSDLPYAAGALPALPIIDAQAVQLATALVDAGEGVLSINAAAAVATAAAAREPTLLAAIAQPLSARSGRLLLALAGGYGQSGIPVLSEPFDRVQATWCVGAPAPAALSVATLYQEAYQSFRAGNPGRAAVERAWVDALQSYAAIFVHDPLVPVPWHEALVIVLLPELYQEILDAAAQLHGVTAVAASLIPSCGALSGTSAAAAYRSWVLTGGSPPEPAAVTLGKAGQLSPARLRLIGALWLMDRCLDDITGTPATASVPAARMVAANLAPLRTLSIALPGFGIGDAAIDAIMAQLTLAQAAASVARSAFLAGIAEWHQEVDASADQDGWGITAARTRRYCVAIATLSEALAGEHAEHAALDFLSMQRDVAAMLSTSLRSAVVVGSPLLCDDIRATRIGAYLVATDLAASSRFSVGVIPDAMSRPLYLPPRIDGETDGAYWQRVCLTVIFPSFERNALEETLSAMAPVWLRMRAGATRQGSCAMDHLGVCAWTIRALVNRTGSP